MGADAVGLRRARGRRRRQGVLRPQGRKGARSAAPHRGAAARRRASAASSSRTSSRPAARRCGDRGAPGGRPRDRRRRRVLDRMSGGGERDPRGGRGAVRRARRRSTTSTPSARTAPPDATPRAGSRGWDERAGVRAHADPALGGYWPGRLGNVLPRLRRAVHPLHCSGRRGVANGRLGRDTPDFGKFVSRPRTASGLPRHVGRCGPQVVSLLDPARIRPRARDLVASTPNRACRRTRQVLR